MPRIRVALHRRVAGVCNSACIAGSTEAAITGQLDLAHGVGDFGPSNSCGTRAWPTRAPELLPYCWRDETPLSNHELRMDDDVCKAISRGNGLGFKKVVGGSRTTAERCLLAGVDDDPVDLPIEPAGAVAGHHLRTGPGGRSPLTCSGHGWPPPANSVKSPYWCSALSRRRICWACYAVCLFHGLAQLSGASRRLCNDRDGTGIVHIAPAYGEDDMNYAEAVGIAPVTPQSTQGRFDVTVADYQAACL